MKTAGPRTEGHISFPLSNLFDNEEGMDHTLPFFVKTPQVLSRYIALDKTSIDTLEEIGRSRRMSIPAHYLGLMEQDNPACPIRMQAVPSPEELEGPGGNDPLGENEFSVTPALVRRHADRAVFLVSSRCAMYCRFCNRKRLVGSDWDPETYREDSLRFIGNHPELREIILSGGDPFMLNADALEEILGRLRAMDHIEIIRISTRMPLVFPDGFTEGHLRAIRRHAPLWIVIHINHPKEISAAFLDLVKKIRETGNMLVSQTVLLRRVNDCPHVLSRLFHRLVSIGVKPYYLFQLDDVTGASHFKVRLDKGIEIMRTLRKNLSGLALPQYIIDIPGGLGKIPIDNPYVKGKEGESIMVESAEGRKGVYCDDGKESRCMECGICREKRETRNAKREK